MGVSRRNISTAWHRDRLPAMKLDWFHFCEYSFETSHGKPGVIGIHAGFLVAAFPAQIPFGIACQISGTPLAKVDVVMRFHDPDGKELVKIEGTKQVNELGTSFVQMFVALSVPKAGVYRLTLSAGGVDLPTQSIPILTNRPLATGTGKPN